MNGVADINYWSLFAGYSILIIPIFVMWYFKTGLLKDFGIAIFRMTVQLMLIGLYLEYMFDYNNITLNISWVVVMTFIASYTIIRRTNMNFKRFIIPVFLSSIFSIAITDVFFLGGIVQLDNMFNARYFIPITGMLIGNTIRTIIIAMNSYYGNINEKISLYRWYLANGATHEEALRPFRRIALRNAFNPMIATTAIVGLISLPGMMTGQILGGSSPNTAIKYQIMLMVTIFSSAVMSVILTLIFSDRSAFDKLGNLKT